MSLTVTLYCTLVIIYRITVIKASIETVTRRLWIEVIVESAALYAVALIIMLAFYARGDTHANYPIVVTTMITVSWNLTLALCSQVTDTLSLGLSAYPDRCSSVERCDEAGIFLAYVSLVYFGVLLFQAWFYGGQRGTSISGF